PAMTGSSSAFSAAGHARRPLATLVVGAIAISFAGILVRLSEAGPAATGFFRFVLALPFLVRLSAAGPAASGLLRFVLAPPVLRLWMIVAQPRSHRQPTRRGERDALLIALGGVFLGLDLAVWNWAIHLSSVSNATLLGNAAPIWVALAGWLFFRERFTWGFLA